MNAKGKENISTEDVKLKQAKESTFNAKSIFERDLAGQTIPLDDPEYPELFKVILKAIRTTAELNTVVTDDLSKIRKIFSKLIGKRVDDTFFIIPPFYT